ncbi:hypothetical protein B0I26_11746 [Anoxybacillus vitaminiphilus]|uniref:Uncharacterized protein n=1 Tax=Paranoxybacillus vitaminiphilus TaxID=581036 RepID=A0A327Y833_9BACL|nr:hypothetical protein B0I26_11746 [Anoxybacillus vitaminiphilus]
MPGESGRDRGRKAVGIPTVLTRIKRFAKIEE